VFIDDDDDFLGRSHRTLPYGDNASLDIHVAIRCKIMLFIGDTIPPHGDLLIHAEMMSLNQRRGSKPLAASTGCPQHPSHVKTFSCAWFDEHDGFEFQPLLGVSLRTEKARSHIAGPDAVLA
jgi:hypothetical protein